jgi:hypothetical protein
MSARGGLCGRLEVRPGSVTATTSTTAGSGGARRELPERDGRRTGWRGSRRSGGRPLFRVQADSRSPPGPNPHGGGPTSPTPAPVDVPRRRREGERTAVCRQCRDGGGTTPVTPGSGSSLRLRHEPGGVRDRRRRAYLRPGRVGSVSADGTLTDVGWTRSPPPRPSRSAGSRSGIRGASRSGRRHRRRARSRGNRERQRATTTPQSACEPPRGSRSLCRVDRREAAPVGDPFPTRRASTAGRRKQVAVRARHHIRRMRLDRPAGRTADAAGRLGPGRARVVARIRGGAPRRTARSADRSRSASGTPATHAPEPAARPRLGVPSSAVRLTAGSAIRQVGRDGRRSTGTGMSRPTVAMARRLDR